MKRTRKLCSVFLILAMLWGMLPMAAVAAEPTEITELSFLLNDIPVVGDPIMRCPSGAIEENDDRIVLTGSSLIWHDDDSDVSINASFDDHGICFEAGRSYNAKFVLKILEPDKYTITENTFITLTNPGDFTYTAKLDEITPTGGAGDEVYADIKLTITMNGQRTYPDITKVVFEDMAAPTADAAQPSANLYYNNCTVTKQEWVGDAWGQNQHGVDTFLEGQSYQHKITLTANEGYRFDESTTALITNGGVEKTDADYAYSNDNRVLTVTFSYDIQGITVLNLVEASLARWNETLTPITGENAVYLASSPNSAFRTDENAPYSIVRMREEPWYDEEGNELDDNDQFEAGKIYYFEIAYSIKNEYEHLYRFAPENLMTKISGNSYSGRGFQTAERVDDNSFDNTYAKFRYYFTAQFPEGVGQTPNNPAMCSTYAEFKYAMENEDIRYVALGNVNEAMPADEEGLVTAIHVNGSKYLSLLGDATFTAPANVATTYAALLHTTNGASLYINGTGSLTFRAAANNSYNAVLYNQGGSVNISGGTLIGSYNTAVYGKAIWQDDGELRITGGQCLAENALTPSALPRAATAVYIGGGKAWIEDGTFQTENVIDTIDLPYGLEIGANATVDLSGGLFYGIKLPTSGTPLANYMDEATYTPLSDESWFNPTSVYSQEYTESGKIVRIAWLIDHVDVHINAPIAGVDITENYFNIPTSGCQAAMCYPMWYKNSEPVTNGTFEAGASYKVVVQIEVNPGYDAEFAKDVTAAVNNKAVTVRRLSEPLIEIEYDFGVCAAAISDVALTVTAPKEGSTPSYTVGCGSDAYYAVGGSSNYTEYRKWYVFSDENKWQEIDKSHQFRSGDYYKLAVEIRAGNGYEFPLYDSGTNGIQPDVSATVNGYSATVTKTYGQDPSRWITVEYNFGECNDDVVETINVTNIDAPVAGQTPDYMANCFGTGYSMAGTNSGNWKVNGIVWLRDGTIYTGSTMDSTEKFRSGHVYTVMIDLVADDGYTFLFDHGNSIYAAATINGNTAQINVDNCSTAKYQVWYTFTCTPPTVESIVLYDLDEPQVGRTPDINVTSAYPELYVADSVRWLDQNGNVVNSFEQGRLYTVEITVAAKGYGCVFADTLNACLNGKEVAGWNNSVTRNNDNTVTIRYQFRKVASAPDLSSHIITAWSGKQCTVACTKFESGITVIAASYESGKLEKVEYLTAEKPSVTLTGDSVKVFFVEGISNAPVCGAVESTRP